MEETITISKKEYNELLDRSNWLDCLQQLGVDNWDGYKFAQLLYAEYHIQEGN